MYVCLYKYINIHTYVTRFAKRSLVRTIINIYKNHFEIFNLLYLKNARRNLCAFLY